MFGDIVDTFWPAVEGPDVDCRNDLGSEDDVEDILAVASTAQRHRHRRRRWLASQLTISFSGSEAA
ncbi:hypothetical protein [Bradyrhizobium cenepequi]